MKKLNHTELALKLFGIKSSFIGLKTETKQNKLNKGGQKGLKPMVESLNIDPDRVVKHSKLTVLVGPEYEKMVNNRLEKENADSQISVTFEAGSLPKGREWVKGAEKVILKNTETGELYLRTYPVANNVPTVSYVFEGAEIDIHDPKFAPYKKPDSKVGSNQGLEKVIPVNDYKFSSIKEITLGGETFEIVAD